ncbi:MAG: hypothetical protein PHO37_13515 [Kiritimatiellae bacterium]|nr:hypothetical protein [Kiritimatiellia bacterium]
MKIKKSSIEQVSEEYQEGAYISERLRNPAELAAGRAGSGKDTLYGIFAIIATVAMIVITVMLYLNWDAFEKTGLFVK